MEQSLSQLTKQESMKTRPPKSLARQAGNMLLSTSISLGIIGLVQIGTTRYAMEKAYQAKGTAIGVQLDSLRANLNSYITTYYGTLTSGSPSVPGVSNPMAPTLAELQSLGLPNTSTISAPAGGGTYLTQVTRWPSGCSGSACNVRGKVWLNTPLTDSTGTPDTTVLGAAVAAGNGGMGYSLPASPTTVSSSAGWTEVNPDPSGQPGILMAVTGYDSSSFAAMIRRDGTATATADHNWGGHSLTNMGTAQAAQIQSTGNVTANGTIQGGYVYSTGDSNTAGTAYSTNSVTNEAYANGWFRSNNAGTGWYNQATGAGIYSNDWWIRAVNDRGFYTGGQVQAGSLQINGGAGIAGQLTAYATPVTYTNGWAWVARDNYGNDNVAPQSAIGSFYANDIYVRAAGKWASQMGGNVPNSYQEFAWDPGSPAEYSTGLSNWNWKCFVTMISGKFAGGGESMQTFMSGDGTWHIAGSSMSDNGGAHARFGCIQLL